MNRELEILQKAVVEVLKCDVSEIGPQTAFVGDLGADSLDAYQILLLVQDETGIELPPDKVERIETIEDAYRLICETLGKEPETL